MYQVFFFQYNGGMKYQLILWAIQILIIGLIIWMLYTILSYAKKHKISLTEKILDRIWHWVCHRSARHLGDWYICDDYNHV